MKYRTMILTVLCLLLNITCLPVAAQTDAPTEKPDGRFIETEGKAPAAVWNSEKADPKYERDIPVPAGVSNFDIDALRDALIARQTEITFEYPVSETDNDIPNKMFFIAMNHTGFPDEGDYIYKHWRGTSYSTARMVDEGKWTVTAYLKYSTTAAQESETTAAVKSILDSLNVYNKNTYQKVKAVYEWLANNISYVDEGDISHSAYAAAVLRRCVCQGYATLFYRLMLELGVDCRYISGTSHGESHGWNIVKLGSLYYNIDSTWASTAHNIPKYFLKGSADFSDHAPKAEFLTDSFTESYPISTSDYVPTNDDLNTGDFIQGVRLEERRIIVPLDQTAALHARVLPDYISQEITYTSLDPSIAEVDAYGNITPKSVGVTLIEVKAAVGGTWYRCKVTVTPEYRFTGRSYSLFAEDGTGYGDLVFFRSNQIYRENQYGTFTDINGNQHTGQLLVKGYENVGLSSKNLPWASVMNKIRKAYVAKGNGIRPAYTMHWFWQSASLQSFDGTGMRGDRLLSMYAMFYDCSSLTSVSLKIGGTPVCEDFQYLFSDCPKLKTVNISGLTKQAIKEGGDQYIFRNSSNVQSVAFGSSKYQLVPELPEHWKKDTYTKTWKQLKDEYPANAKQYAGTWTKTHVHTYGTPTYTWSSDNKTVTAKAVCTGNSSHVLTETVKTTYARTKQPTRTATGTGVYTAKFTNSMFKTQTKTITVAKLPSIAMYRLYNPNSWEHFYTGNAKEKTALVNMGWKYEGVGWYAPKTSKTPVYRLYNPNNGGDHHYTMNKKEYDALCKAGWTGEGVRWYSDDAKGVPVYREYNPGAAIRNHNYTANKKEHNALISYGWKDEGIGWYGMK